MGSSHGKLGNFLVQSTVQGEKSFNIRDPGREIFCNIIWMDVSMADGPSVIEDKSANREFQSSQTELFEIRTFGIQGPFWW
jgi:hypothetical protein